MILFSMTLDPGLVYTLFGALLSVNAALLGWILNGIVNLRGRMHRLEARDQFVDANILELKNRLNELFDELLPHNTRPHRKT